eukprot:CAMPEP_0115253482 /NCGR_PEP_ID=MMETSP0270-20121206/44694_1 /TAXON_ID=71861 /ORGANISM="Scrippsiella trochoidea, Strain CCMP3099" /LENGTH=32 /DNA_ID= /DNA_START= /DNA_END= /DNA_ORIENTATION=
MTSGGTPRTQAVSLAGCRPEAHATALLRRQLR